LHLGGFKQGQLATARELAAAAHPGRELLELQVLEIEQHHGLEIANRLAGHGEGSIAAAQALVAALDARSLATHRPVTRALAAEVLDSAAPE
jgi:chromosomal replication initiation ATPase DnaA